MNSPSSPPINKSINRVYFCVQTQLTDARW